MTQNTGRFSRKEVTYIEVPCPRLGTPCWNCTSHSLANKRPTILVDRKRISVAQYMWCQYHGPWPDGMDVFHECHNNLCINPDHIRPGTRSENIKEKIRLGIRKLKLSAEQISEALLSPLSATELAEKFGVSQMTVVRARTKAGQYRGGLREPTYIEVPCPALGTPCWNCTSHAVTRTNPYPNILVGDKRIRVAKYMWSKRYGPWPDKMEMLHACDNKLCINPDHIRPGTQKENVQEAVERGRFKHGGAK